MLPQELLQTRPLVSVPPDRYPQSPRLQLDPRRVDVVIEPTSDGPDYIKVCVRHQWASLPTPDHAPACPLCIAEADASLGHDRYAQLHARLFFQGRS